MAIAWHLFRDKITIDAQFATEMAKDITWRHLNGGQVPPGSTLVIGALELRVA